MAAATAYTVLNTPVTCLKEIFNTKIKNGKFTPKIITSVRIRQTFTKTKKNKFQIWYVIFAYYQAHLAVNFLINLSIFITITFKKNCISIDVCHFFGAASITISSFRWKCIEIFLQISLFLSPSLFNLDVESCTKLPYKLVMIRRNRK